MKKIIFYYLHSEYEALPKWLRHHLLSEYKWKVDSLRTYFLSKI